MDIWMDSSRSVHERAKALLAQLSLEEELAQLQGYFAVIPDDGSLEKVCRLGIGQISALRMRECHTVAEAAEYQRKAQQKVMELSPHHIPAIFHMEGLCGAMLQDSMSFPSGGARGSAFDPELEEEIGKVVSRQEAACGITHVFAPVLDVAADPRLGRAAESYGEDPVLVGQLGSAYTRGIQQTETGGRHPEAVGKHFVAFHRAAGGIHGAWVDMPERPLIEHYAKGFQAAISTAGLRGVMPCYCLINGEPVHGSRHLLTEILRGEMGFDGLVVSDYCGIENMHTQQMMAEDRAEAGLRALDAGVDQEVQYVAGYCDEMLRRLKEISGGTEQLHTAVLHVLEAKLRMGLFEHPFAMEPQELPAVFNRDQAREVSLRAAREGQILLKNSGVLPLEKKYKKIAIIGCHADDARYFFGGYTHVSMTEGTYARLNTMGGVEALPWQNGEYEPIPGTKIQSADTEQFRSIFRRQQPHTRSLLEELRVRMPETEFVYAYGYPMAGDDCSYHEEALNAAKDADLILLTLGGRYGSCSVASMAEGVDATDICLPPCQDRLLEKLAVLNKPLVGVHFNGRPISSDVADKELDAILEAWTLSECGAQAICDVLLGDVNPSGRLPVSVAYNAGQLPLIYDHPNGSGWHQTGSIGFKHYVDMPHTPRYPFGFGLSYTAFAYEDLSVTPDETAPEQPVTIAFTVRNTGDRAGTEVAQLYLSDRYATIARPNMQLAGFARVELKPGESKRVTFSLQPGALAFPDRNMKWKIEAGDIDVMAGSSSMDIRLTGSFRIVSDAWIAGKDRPLWAELKSIL